MPTNTENNYDFVIFGTGLIESLLAAELSTKKYKVLIIDNEKNYGTDFLTLNYLELTKKFDLPVLEELKKFNNEFNIDLIPKIFLSNGNIQSIIEKYKIEEIVKFKLIEGSYINKNKNIYKIPTSEGDSLKTKLVGLWEKPKLINFFYNIRKYAEAVEKNLPYKLKKTTKKELDNYGLSTQTQEIIGHAIALNLDDDYLELDPKTLYDKIVLYVSSIINSKGVSSPYIYPEYGLSEVCQFLSRVTSVSGGVFRLNTRLLQLDFLEEKNQRFNLEILDHDDKIKNILCKNIVSHPSYFENDVVLNYEVIRCICIIKIGEEKNLISQSDSGSVVFLKSDLKRENDVFLLFLSNKQKVCPKGYKIAIISTKRETQEEPESEISFVYEKLGNIRQKFVSVEKIYKPIDEAKGFYIIDNIDHTPSVESGFEKFDEILKKIEFDNF